MKYFLKYQHTSNNQMTKEKLMASLITQVSGKSGVYYAYEWRSQH